MRIFGGDKLFGRRKFIIALLIELLATLGLVLGYLESGHYRDIAIGVMGLYGLSAVGNQLAKNKANNGGAP